MRLTAAGNPDPNNPPAWAWPAVSLVLLAAAGLLAALWWSGRPPAEGDPAVTFARDMIAHHSQAVQMALAVRDRTADPDLRQVALDIILTQQAQIGQMQAWLELWDLPFSGPSAPMTDHSDHSGAMPPNMGMAAPADVAALATLPVAEAEAQFLRLMIAHHEGGVYMAEHALDHTARAPVVRLAESIVASQTTEMGLLKDMLTKRGRQP